MRNRIVLALALLLSLWLCQPSQASLRAYLISNDGNALVKVDVTSGAILSTTALSSPRYGYIGLTSYQGALYSLGKNQPPARGVYLDRIDPVTGQVTTLGSLSIDWTGRRHLEVDPTTGIFWGGGRLDGPSFNVSYGTFDLSNPSFNQVGSLRRNGEIASPFGMAIDPTTGVHYYTNDDYFDANNTKFNAIYRRDGRDLSLVGPTLPRKNPQPGAALVLQIAFSSDGRLFALGGNGDPDRQRIWELDKTTGQVLSSVHVPSTHGAYQGIAFETSAAAVPEPSSLIALAGLIPFALLGRRWNQRR